MFTHEERDRIGAALRDRPRIESVETQLHATGLMVNVYGPVGSCRRAILDVAIAFRLAVSDIVVGHAGVSATLVPIERAVSLGLIGVTV